MKTWEEYNLEVGPLITCGTSPTDFDSAGKDQDLDNSGRFFDPEAMEKTVKSIRDREKNEIEYGKKIHDLMTRRGKEEGDDPNVLDPTKGPKGESDGGMVDKDEKDSIKDYLKKMDALYKKENDDRKEVPVKTTSTMFIADKKNSFSPRNDSDPYIDKSGA